MYKTVTHNHKKKSIWLICDRFIYRWYYYFVKFSFFFCYKKTQTKFKINQQTQLQNRRKCVCVCVGGGPLFTRFGVTLQYRSNELEHSLKNSKFLLYTIYYKDTDLVYSNSLYVLPCFLLPPDNA